MAVMRTLEICLPFGLPPPELGADLLRQADAPALARLISRSKARNMATFEEFARTLPHERWLSRQLGLASRDEAADSPPVAGILMREFGMPAAEGCWFVLQPAVLHVARDHLVLTDLRGLNLGDREARELFADAREACEESGLELRYGDARTWFLRADAWAGLNTSTPDAACGRNIDIWMPKGTGERDWRRLLNEVQMRWHTHPVNEARAQNGENPVNSVWLWGRTDATTGPAARKIHSWGMSGDALDAHAFAKLDAPPPLLLDRLIAPALAQDWGAWLQALHALDTEWFVPLLDLLGHAVVDEIDIAVTDASRLLTMRCNRLSLKKFWVSPALTPLVP